jgi:S-adenosylmethionine:tRNA ribosyltransferase-isomerase
MKLSDFDFHLPDDRIAQHPLDRRDGARMLTLAYNTGAMCDRQFADLPELLRGDELLVLNNTRVIRARLLGRRTGEKAEVAGRKAGGEFLSAEIEVLLTRPLGDDRWQALVRPGRKVRVGERIVFAGGELRGEVTGRGALGIRELHFTSRTGSVHDAIERLGHVPLPPYIARPDDGADRERYQTVFARQEGAVAAPTAGLHFTQETIRSLAARGVEICEVTLHVGLGTFQPIHGEDLEGHRMHAEAYEIPEKAAYQICRARQDGRPVFAVGTTVVRALEDAAAKQAARGAADLVAAGPAEAEAFIRPGHKFRVVRQMLTNFHLPRSTLLLLVSALAGREKILNAYAHAIAAGYRFYSYGDCMMIRER